MISAKTSGQAFCNDTSKKIGKLVIEPLGSSFGEKDKIFLNNHIHGNTMFGTDNITQVNIYRNIPEYSNYIHSKFTQYQQIACTCEDFLTAKYIIFKCTSVRSERK